MSEPTKRKTKPARRTNRNASPAPIAVIVGHADLPAALRAAALSIIPNPDAIVSLSNENRTKQELDRELHAVADRHPGVPILIFADMRGSSCCQAGSRLKAARPDVELVSGANMPMLVRFLQHRKKKSFSALVRLMRVTARQESRFD